MGECPLLGKITTCPEQGLASLLLGSPLSTDSRQGGRSDSRAPGAGQGQKQGAAKRSHTEQLPLAKRDFPLGMEELGKDPQQTPLRVGRGGEDGRSLTLIFPTR